MQRRTALIAATLAAGITLAGCAKPVQSGYVVEKQYVPSRDWIDMMPNYYRTCVSIPYTYTTGSGTNRRTVYTSRQSCTSRLIGYIPIHRHEDRYFRLDLRDDRDTNRTGWRDVTEQEYGRYEVGAHYPDPR